MPVYYKEAAVAGQRYQRCYDIHITNPLAGGAVITCHEEEVIDLGGGETMRRPVGQVSFPFEPAAEIQLIDPSTGQPTGAVMTQQEVYVALFSAYMAAAQARDAQQTP